jgi:hypothetical protein
MSQSDDFADFFNVSEDLVGLPKIKQARSSQQNFDGLLSEPLVLYEDLKNGCGGQLWPAGMVLAKYILRQPSELVKSKTMYE